MRKIPSNRKFVLIGGFAVSAYDFPRLSVDLDIVIPEKELVFFRALLNKEGFVLSKKKSNLDLIYGGKYEKYIKKERLPISVDLLINSVQSRQTNYPYSFQYLFENSELREVRGWHPATRARVRVPNKEILIALKINSMRTADKRDIIMLCYERPNVDKIFAHLKNCPIDIILHHINELLELLTDPKHKDALKGVFSISSEVLKKAVSNCKNVLSKVKTKIERE